MKWPRMGTEPSRARRENEVAAIILPHLDSAHNLARWLVRDASLAEDVVQDAMVRALRAIASFEGGDARAWLMRIVRNVAYDAMAARRRRNVTEFHADVAANGDEPMIERVADTASDPEAALCYDQDRAALATALADLPVDLRECLVLRELEELSYKEIAQVVGIPVGTVMSRLWRARRALMEIAAKGTTR